MYELTKEQNEFISSFSKGGAKKIKALAGCGKTTTLVELAIAKHELKGLYLVFGKANKEEARTKFSKNIKVMNTHGFSYGLLKRSGILNRRIDIKQDENGAEYFEALSGKIVYLESMEFRRVEDSYIVSEHGDFKYISTKFGMNKIRKNYKASELCRMFGITDKESKGVLSVLEGFLNSHANSINVDRSLSNRYAQLLFNKMLDGEIWITHSFYLKCCQLLLKNKVLFSSYDFIMIDEMQDSNMVTLSVCDAIKAKHKVFVGDEHQQVYSFRDSVNAMDKIVNAEIFTLSETFRLPVYVVDKVNDFLKKFKNSDIFLKSNKILDDKYNLDDKDCEHIERISNSLQRCYISRSNSVLISRMIILISERKKFKTIRHPDEIFSLSEEIIYLKDNERGKISINKHLLDHETFGDLEVYANNIEDKEILSALGIIEKYEERLGALKKIATKYYGECEVSSEGFNDFLTTAHTSKGLEWEYICMENSFPDFIGLFEKSGVETIEEFREKIKEIDPKIVDEFNLFYVSMTRAKVSLEIEDENEFYLGLEDWEINKLIVAYREAKEAAIKFGVPFEFNPRAILGYEEEGFEFEDGEAGELTIEQQWHPLSSCSNREDIKVILGSGDLGLDGFEGNGITSDELTKKLETKARENKKKEALIDFASELDGWCEPYIEDKELYINSVNVGTACKVGVRIGNGIRIHPMDIYIEDDSIKIKNETKWKYSDITVFDVWDNIPKEVVANSKRNDPFEIQKKAEAILLNIKENIKLIYPSCYELDISINLTLNSGAKDINEIKLGKAMPMDNNNYIIFLDKKLIQKYGKKYLKEVISHEYAHIIFWETVDNHEALEIHGKEWKEIMKNFGYKRAKTSTTKFGSSEDIMKLHN